MDIKKVGSYLIGGVIVLVGVYSLGILYFTWPISEFSIDKSGTFGDSFGVLTALFSGLAFSGMIITILLQHEELRLQRQELEETRKEFAKGADAQQRNAKLNALSTLLIEYRTQILANDDIMASKENAIANATFNSTPYMEENADLRGRKGVIIRELEAMLEEIRVTLKKT